MKLLVLLCIIIVLTCTACKKEEAKSVSLMPTQEPDAYTEQSTAEPEEVLPIVPIVPQETVMSEPTEPEADKGNIAATTVPSDEAKPQSAATAEPEVTKAPAAATATPAPQPDVPEETPTPMPVPTQQPTAVPEASAEPEHTAQPEPTAAPTQPPAEPQAPAGDNETPRVPFG